MRPGEKAIASARLGDAVDGVAALRAGFIGAREEAADMVCQSAPPKTDSGYSVFIRKLSLAFPSASAA